jgi:hypothetical protein
MSSATSELPPGWVWASLDEVFRWSTSDDAKQALNDYLLFSGPTNTIAHFIGSIPDAQPPEFSSIPQSAVGTLGLVMPPDYWWYSRLFHLLPKLDRPYQTRCSSAVGPADRYLDPEPDRRVVCPIGTRRKRQKLLP